MVVMIVFVSPFLLPHLNSNKSFVINDPDRNCVLEFGSLKHYFLPLSHCIMQAEIATTTNSANFIVSY